MPEPSRAELKYLIERQKEEIKTINEVGRLISSTTDAAQIIRLVASYLKQLFPIALCGVLLFKPLRLQFVRFAPIGEMEMTNAVGQLLERAKEYTKESLKEGGLSLLVEDPSDPSGAWKQAAIGSLRSHVAVPLSFDRDVEGLLGVFSAQAQGLGKGDIRTIEIVAGQLHSALRNALLLAQLLQVDRMKSDLLSILSHELRVPLTVIQEGVELLQDGTLGSVNKEQQDFLKTVNQNVQRLRRLMDKVLLATQVITGQLQYHFASADIGLLLTELNESFRLLAQEKKISLEVLSGSEMMTPMVDEEKLKQALAQIVENAIQTTPAGGRVTLTWSKAAKDVEIQIADAGAGIPEEELPKIFDQFRSVGGIHDRKTGGLGLGLFMAKALIEAHGGTIRLESAAGKGTRVVIRLPQKQQPAVAE